MYLVFDTETTGLPRDWRAPVSDLGNWPRVVQLAWRLFDANGTPLDHRSSIVRPDGFTIPAEVASVHGITTARARTEGVPLADVLRDFVSGLKNAKVLVAHNFSFDSKVIGAELLRSGMKSGMARMPHVCTMERSTEFCALPGRGGFKYPSLDELHRHLFGAPATGAHTALGDVDACARCFFELKRLGVLE